MSSPAVAPQQFRDLMAGVCAPVTVVTTTIDGTPHGATVSSFSSLSLDPPLISVALNRNSALLAGIRSAGRFGVNLLGLAQDELAMTFARPSQDRFAGIDWYLSAGLPRLTEAAGWIDCELYQAVEWRPPVAIPSCGPTSTSSAVAARHAVVSPMISYEVYGKALLGREDQITPLV